MRGGRGGDDCKMCQSRTITDKRCLQSNYESSWRMQGCYRTRARSVVSNSVCIYEKECRGRRGERGGMERETVTWAEAELRDGSD